MKAILALAMLMMLAIPGASAATDITPDHPDRRCYPYEPRWNPCCDIEVWIYPGIEVCVYRTSQGGPGTPHV